MSAEAYRYKFAEKVLMEDVEASLVRAILATESLHSEAQVRLDAAHFLDRDRRTCVIDAATEVGQDFNRLFMGFLRREFGSGSFTVARSQAPAVAA